MNTIQRKHPSVRACSFGLKQNWPLFAMYEFGIKYLEIEATLQFDCVILKGSCPEEFGETVKECIN